MTRTPIMKGDGSFRLEVAGERSYLANFEQIFGKRNEDGVDEIVVAMLVCEPSNPYDPNAVRVDIERLTVGYIPRSIAPTIGQLIRSQGGDRAIAKASVRGGWDRGDGDTGDFGVRLDVVLPVKGATRSDLSEQRVKQARSKPWWRFW